MNMINAPLVQEFRRAFPKLGGHVVPDLATICAQHNLIPPDDAEPGEQYRLSDIDKDGGVDGWLLMMDDGAGGHIQNHRTDSQPQTFFFSAGAPSVTLEQLQMRENKRAARDAAAAGVAAQLAQMLPTLPPATAEHPYLRRKGVPAHPGLAVEVSDWRPTGKADMHERDKQGAALVIPVVSAATGQLLSVQRIYENGEKRFAHGSYVKGGMFWIGGAREGPWLLAEGYATAATLHQATGYAVGVVFSSAGFLPVLQALRAAWPAQEVIVCADRGNGEAKAREAAAACGVRCVAPAPPAGYLGSDFNDLAVPLGLDWVAAQVIAADVPAVVLTEQPLPRDERYDDFLAHLPSNTYYHIPTGQFFPAASIDNLLYPMDIGEVRGSGTRKTEKATKWLSRNHAVHQSTWWPGAPRVIDGWVYDDGVMVQHPGMKVLNLYREPTPPQPHGGPVDRWINHIRTIYPHHWQLVLAWMAFVAQNPTVKVNFALVIGGSQGIGKDSILAPLERVVGGRNWRETSPEVILTSQFTEYLQCRVLRINEAKDTGGESRFQFYERCKTIIAAPPNVHSINAKGQRPYQIPNLNATIITTNHRSGGLYLPADDRRHLVVFSDAVRTQFSDAYWNDYHQWMGNGGIEDCAAWLLSHDVTQFNPKVPTQTDAFLEMVEGGQSADHHDLADLVELAGDEPFTIEKLAFLAMGNGDRDLSEDLRNRGKLPKIKRALSDLGVKQYKNPNTSRGRWVINGKHVTLYKRCHVA